MPGNNPLPVSDSAGKRTNRAAAAQGAIKSQVVSGIQTAPCRQALRKPGDEDMGEGLTNRMRKVVSGSLAFHIGSRGQDGFADGPAS